MHLDRLVPRVSADPALAPVLVMLDPETAAVAFVVVLKRSNRVLNPAPESLTRLTTYLSKSLEPLEKYTPICKCWN